jgi:hypothetical protein
MDGKEGVAGGGEVDEERGSEQRSGGRNRWTDVLVPELMAVGLSA